MCRRRLALAIVTGLSLTTLAPAGAQAPESPEFEVVAIRPLQPSNDFDVFNLPDRVALIGDRLQARNISAHALIHAAYGSEFVHRDQIVGADGWIASERFDVDARAAAPLTEKAVSTPLPHMAELMLRQTLEQRFQLRVRRDTRALPRLVLTHAASDRSLKKGIRLSDLDCTKAPLATAGECAYSPMPGNLSMRGRPMQSLVDFLSIRAYAGGRVVDGTGITGHVDVDLEWAMDWSDLQVSNVNLATAVREQLGLKLESRRLPLPVLVIEEIRRSSAN